MRVAVPPKGTYFNLKMWEYVYLDNDKTVSLPGKTDAKYLKLPIWLSIITGPIGGLALVIFIPLAGIIGLCYYLSLKLKGIFSRPSHKNLIKPE